MTGIDVVKTAFDLKESARIPTTLIAGGSWAIHTAGETFAGVKEKPERIADVFVQACFGFGMRFPQKRTF